ELTLTSTKAEEWEEISFAFSSRDTNKFDRMVLFFNFSGEKGATAIHYADDIVLAEGGSTEEPPNDSEPANNAPHPNVDEDRVISLFSDEDTNVTVDTWRTDWSNAHREDFSINNDNIKKYSNLNVVGIETDANQLDVSNMTHFHVDIWTANATEFRIKLDDFGADGAFNGGDDVEHEIVIYILPQQEWCSIVIPFSEFIGRTTYVYIAHLTYVA